MIDLTSGPGSHVEVDSRGGVGIFRLNGPIDSSTAGPVRRALAAAAGLDKVLIDLSEVTALAPAGIGVLMGAVRQIQEAHGAVVLVAPPERIADLLLTAGVDHLTGMVQTADEGVRLLTDPLVAPVGSSAPAAL